MINEFKKNIEGKRVVLYGASFQGQKTYNLLKDINIDIDYFCDSDEIKWGKNFCDKKILSLEELKNLGLKKDKELLVIITSMYVQEIITTLNELYIDCVFQTYKYIDEIYGKDNEYVGNIKKYKDKHKGQRCFIIGNGPSLNVEDLDKLKDEITFASNRIYLLFDKTKWRPNYYSMVDMKMLNNYKEDVAKLELENIFIPLRAKEHFNKYTHNIQYMNFRVEIAKPSNLKFSSDISNIVYNGYTVTYALIQFAIYMGFNEINLLGVDHNYSQYRVNGKVITTDYKDNFSEEYITEGEDRCLPELGNSEIAYKLAYEYCTNNNIKIHNCTRGGKLEVFPRKKFEECFI